MQKNYLETEKLGKLIFKYSMPCVVSLLVGAVALVIAECFPKALINLFGAKNESVYYTDFAVLSFRVYLSMIVLACVNKATFIFLQAMGKVAAATGLSMVREIVFGVGYALILPIWFDLNGVLYSMPAADISAFIITAIIVALTIKRLNLAVNTNRAILPADKKF